MLIREIILEKIRIDIYKISTKLLEKNLPVQRKSVEFRYFKLPELNQPNLTFQNPRFNG